METDRLIGNIICGMAGFSIGAIFISFMYENKVKEARHQGYSEGVEYMHKLNSIEPNGLNVKESDISLSAFGGKINIDSVSGWHIGDSIGLPKNYKYKDTGEIPFNDIKRPRKHLPLCH